jgi:hypothetical protein
MPVADRDLKAIAGPTANPVVTTLFAFGGALLAAAAGLLAWIVVERGRQSRWGALALVSGCASLLVVLGSILWLSGVLPLDFRRLRRGPAGRDNRVRPPVVDCPDNACLETGSCQDGLEKIGHRCLAFCPGDADDDAGAVGEKDLSRHHWKTLLLETPNGPWNREGVGVNYNP